MPKRETFHTNWEKFLQIFNLFDIENLTIDDHLQVYFWLFRSLGFGYLDEDYCKSLCPIYAAISYGCHFYYIYCSVVFIRNNLNDIDVVIEIFATMLCVAVMVLKSWILLVYREEIREIIEDIRTIYDDIMEKGGMPKVILLKRMKEARILMRIFYFTIVCVPILFTSCALAKYDERLLPLAPTDAFMPHTDTPYYQMTFLLHFWVMWIVVNIMVGFEAFFIYTLLMLCSVIEVLNHKVSTIGESREYFKSHIDNYISNSEELFYLDKVSLQHHMDHEFTQKILKECFNMHQHIIAYAGRVNNVYRLDGLLEVLLSTCVGCVSLYQVCESTSDAKIAFYLYMTCCVGQIFIYCWYGELIKVKSVSIGDAIAAIPWYRLGSRQRLQLQLMMHMSQQPLYISAVFTNLSLDCFTTIMRSTFSFYTFLTSMK